jgi:hypothetical protein
VNASDRVEQDRQHTDNDEYNQYDIKALASLGFVAKDDIAYLLFKADFFRCRRNSGISPGGQAEGCVSLEIKDG